jgi:hypothetical protein
MRTYVSFPSGDGCRLVDIDVKNRLDDFKNHPTVKALVREIEEYHPWDDTIFYVDSEEDAWQLLMIEL